MAGYDATINLRVTGGNTLEGVITRTRQLQNIVESINKTQLDLSKPFGRGKAADEFNKAATVLNNLKREFVNSTSAVQGFGAASTRSIANIKALGGAFDALASNVAMGTGQFREFTVAAEQASAAAGVAERKRLDVLRGELSFGGIEGKTIGGGSLVQELLAQEKQIPKTKAALASYRSDLVRVQDLVDLTSKEFIELEAAINRVNVAMGKGPLQGPALPPGFNEKGRKPTKPTKTGPQSFLETFGAFGLGGGFPLLFGGGAGQVAGGLLGTALAKSFGLASEAAMGLQIALSAILGKVEELVTRFREVGNAVGSVDMDALANTFITVNENARTLTRQLVEAGNAQDAISVAARETALQTGVLPEATSDITNNVNLLSNTWDEVVGSVSGLVSIIATPFVSALTLVLQLVAKVTQGVNFILSGVGLIIKKITEALFQLPGLKQILEFIKENTKGTVEEQEKGLAVLKKSGEELTREYNQNVALTKIEMKRTAGRTAAEKLVNAEIDKRMGLKKLEFDTEDKIRETRLKFANETSEAAQIELAYQEQIIKQNAKVEKYKINQTFELAKQNIELEAQKEKEKELEELAKKRSEKYKEMAEDVKLQTQLLTDQAESLNYQSTITNNIASLNNARRQTESDLLDLQISRLERQKDEARHFLDKIKLNNIIIDKRKEQAKLEYESQRTSIKLTVAKAEQERIQIRLKEQQIKLQLEQVRLEAEAIQDADRRNAALNRINKQEQSTLQVVKDMNRAADHSLETTRKIASFQEQSAKYAYQGKIEALETARQQEKMAIFLNSQKGSMNSLAAQSGTYASNMERAANAASRPIVKDGTFEERFGLGRTETVTVTTAGPIDADIRKRVESRGGFGSVEAMVNEMNRLQAERNADKPTRYAEGGYATKPHIGMVGEAGPEYIIPERKAAAFATNYLMGARGAGAIPRYAEGGYVGPVNIQTGPVMQQGGTNYVTMAQFEKGLMDLATAVSASNRSYGARQYLGVQR